MFSYRQRYAGWIKGSNAHGRLSIDMDLIRSLVSLYFAGFKDACCVHRAYFFCRRSQKVFLRTVQCFLLNGFIFLGIYYLIQRLVAPMVHRILTFPIAEEQHQGSPLIETFLLYLCQGLLVFPLYVLSYVASCIWYAEIAQQAFSVLEYSSHEDKKEHAQLTYAIQEMGNQTNSGLDGILFSAGEQAYSILMLLIFYCEVRVASSIPYIGNIVMFPLRSWLYAFYFFDYAWSYGKWSLQKRLLFFETNWAFFAGFGCPCVIATLPLYGLVQDGVLAFLFPLFVLVAFGSQQEQVVAANNNIQPQLPRVPMFYLTSILMNKLFAAFKMTYGWFQKAPQLK
ncbi:hypothetical protein KP509_30G069300 [Ceratopteris richardii]|uniref:Uncharacterized protein n=3 Tax=Ceratopteris richardii TaxID=49495 RepID=A0A8T2R594_CERRI|nr:hypothetical protein KP509_30G069300 [Ceratopteris richardii]